MIKHVRYQILLIILLSFKDSILISILVGKFKMLKDFDDNMFLNELH